MVLGSRMRDVSIKTGYEHEPTKPDYIILNNFLEKKEVRFYK